MSEEQIGEAILLKISHVGWNMYVGIDFFNGLVVAKQVNVGDRRDKTCADIAKELRERIRDKCNCLRCACNSGKITTFKQIDLSKMNLEKAEQQF